MEVKKSPQADLENKKNIFLEIGLMLALGTILFAFEWKVSGRQPADFVTVSEIPTEIEMVPITMMHQITPPPPPTPKPFDLLEIVDEIDPLSDDLDIIDADDESNNKESFDLNNLNYDEKYDTDEVIAFVPSEDMPVFPENIQKWLSKHVKYPQIALENGVQGKVFVQFVVEKDGSVSNIKVVRGVDASLDKEAVRVVSVMPKWKPGKQRGKAVRVAYTLPIAFQIGSY